MVSMVTFKVVDNFTKMFYEVCLLYEKEEGQEIKRSLSFGSHKKKLLHIFFNLVSSFTMGSSLKSKKCELLKSNSRILTV